MEISNLSFIVTADCNYRCSYCPQKKEKITMTNHTVDMAVDFFYPYMSDNDENNVGFYGGEPMLAFDKIEHAVLRLKGKNSAGNKKIKFSMTTNGSLLTDESLEFFERHRFLLVLSFDGLAQDKGRKKGTLDQMTRLIKQTREHPGIEFEINSVFTPRTIGDFFESMRFMVHQGCPAITYNISTIEEWSASDLEILETELNKLTDFLVSYYKEEGKVPVRNFQAQGLSTGNDPGPGVFRCGAGEKRMAVTPEGELWGCSLFYDYFKTRKDSPQRHDYALGTLADFIANDGVHTCYPRIVANYSELRQDLFKVNDHFCFLCDQVKACKVCPVNAAYSSGSIGKISCSHCRIIHIDAKARRTINKSHPK